MLLVLILQSAGAWRQSNGQSYYIQPASTATASTTSEEINCDELFTVDRAGYYQKRYEGTLLLKSDVTLRDVEIDLRFDRPVDLLVVSNGTAKRLC